MKIYRITSRHEQLTDISTPHAESEVSGQGLVDISKPVYIYDSSAGTFHKSGAGSFNYSGFLRSSPANPGNYLSYHIKIPKGEYKVFGVFMKSSSSGIVKCCIAPSPSTSGGEIGTADLYSDSPLYTQVVELGTYTATEDTLQHVCFSCSSKNASSSSYEFDLLAFHLIRQI